jgi:hypothetical protein
LGDSSLYYNIIRTIKIINSLLTIKNKDIYEIYYEYHYKNDEKIRKKYVKNIKYNSNDIDKFRDEAIKDVEKYVFDYYNIIKDVF